MAQTRRLVIVSVRLPVSVRKDGTRWQAEASPGGLATALRALAESRPFTWIGWPGTDALEQERGAIEEVLGELGGNVPVFPDPADFKGFYEEFSNRVLWPLFHGLTSQADYDREGWRCYRRVNELFADVVAREVQPGDLVWVHDYQLALLPRMLRERGLDIATGFFLHIPFPSSEIYRTLPVRDEILRGMLGANLIGFHTYDYIRHFRSACLRVLGHDSEPDAVPLPTHTARLSVLPIGIEPAQFRELGSTEESQREVAALESRYSGKKVIVGVDRLDYTKGIPQKLAAFGELLENHEEWRERAVLIQVASPSRMGVQEYKLLKREVDEIVGDINGRYGTVDWTPIVYINQHMDRSRLYALFRIADVGFVTPVRDGMNLVALEYVVARGERPGTLILSEFAGSAASLAGARLVNPHNTTEMAEILADALRRGTGRDTFAQMVSFAESNTSVAWAEKFLSRLERSYEAAHEGPRPLDVAKLDESQLGIGKGRPVLLLDYDGTLEPHALFPEQAVPGERVLSLLERLAGMAVVYVVSGRPAETLEEWLGHLPIGLACEHGLSIKPFGGEWSERPKIDRAILDELVLPVMHDFVESTPGSKLERKDASLAWHYRAADPQLGSWRAKELHTVLEESLRGHEFNLLAGSKVLEVRHHWMSKARAVGAVVERHPDAGLIAAIGNDRTDEEMFDALHRAGHEPFLTCRIGTRITVARYFLETPAALHGELDKLLERWSAASRV